MRACEAKAVVCSQVPGGCQPAGEQPAQGMAAGARVPLGGGPQQAAHMRPAHPAAGGTLGSRLECNSNITTEGAISVVHTEGSRIPLLVGLITHIYVILRRRLTKSMEF